MPRRRLELVVGERNPLFKVISDALNDGEPVRRSSDPPPELTMTVTVADATVEYRLQGKPELEWYGGGLVLSTRWRSEGGENPWYRDTPKG